ncbi:MAG: STAS domain-containing protein [Planctomycetes bacterium]|nr:STAS domain-containing protein [Planctomycetota bacterium]
MVLDFANVNYLNSSNIAKLLKLRKHDRHGNGKPLGKLRLCAIKHRVWGVFLSVTGLDKIFDFCDNVPSGLASVQLEA